MAMPERETFEGALKSGRQALEALGLGRYEARERADLFRHFKEALIPGIRVEFCRINGLRGPTAANVYLS
ncbi:cold shock domain-containing protein [Salmonella enterica subsp. enterica serovar Lubbock]|nr:cold shock domain-containing protein [Salmonella enterica subsp. enterica serovar Lubbock]